MPTVLQSRLPYTPWSDPAMRRLPGIQPARPGDAFAPDEAFEGQMAERDRLISSRPDDVLALEPEGGDAASELLEMALAEAGRQAGYASGQGAVVRPGGVEVPIDRGRPLSTLGRLFQQDFCILSKPEGENEHRLVAAVLCFPAGWTLSEKIGRPLLRIHGPVASYDGDVGRRVQRLHDALTPGRALWRANAHFADSPALFTPRREGDPRPSLTENPRYIRSEQQVLFRLPETGAVVFSIHTIMVPVAALDADQARTLAGAGLRPG